MLKKVFLPIMGGALLLGGALSAHAQMTHDQLSALISKAKEYGFTHIVEIDIDSDMSAEVEGWVDPNTYATVWYSSTGEKTRDKRKDKDEAYGLDYDALANALAAAQANGLVTIENIEIDDDGDIEIEGQTIEKKDKKIRLQLNQVAVPAR